MHADLEMRDGWQSVRLEAFKIVRIRPGASGAVQAR
jgi:hypothetical protein